MNANQIGASVFLAVFILVVIIKGRRALKNSKKEHV